MKKILVALVMLALVFGSAAALEASLTVDIDTEALIISKTGNSDIVEVGSFDQAYAGNNTGWQYDDSTINFTFKDDDGKFGGQIQFDVAGTFGTPNVLNNFANLNAWIMLGEYVKFTAGRIQSNPTPRLNSIVDEQHLGPMNGAYQTVNNGFRTDHLIYTSARDLEYMVDFYLGKFFDQDYTISGAVFHTAGVKFDGSDDTSGGDGMVITGIGARFSGTFVPDLLKLNLTYSWRKLSKPTITTTSSQADIDEEVIFNQTKSVSANGQQYRNNLGLYAQVTPMDALKLTAGYGISFRFIPFADTTYVDQDGDGAITGTETAFKMKDFEKSNDMYHGIDVRAAFAVTDTILIEGQLNVSFGETVLRATPDMTGGKLSESGHTYFGIFGGLGASIGFTDTLSASLFGVLWADNATAVAKYDGDDAGGDGVKTATTNFTIQGTLAYAVSKAAEARIGLRFETTEVKVDGERDDSAYPVTRFSIPVGITVKF